MTTTDELAPAKHSIITEMYLHTADENYIVARWAHDNGLWTDFFWNSVHALEKYMKASLLMNGLSVRQHSHRLVPLYMELETLASDLLPSVLSQPPTLEIHHWKDLTPPQFLDALDRNGNADNRYLTYGFIKHVWYLHMLDSIVWAVRRLVIELDRPIIRRSDVPAAPTHREVLRRQPDYAPNHFMPLDKVICGEDTALKRAALNLNIAFAPEDYPHQPTRASSSSRNPVLVRRIFDPLASGREDYAAHGYRLAEWLLANTKLPSVVRKEIADEMKKAFVKHPGIKTGS